MQRSQVDNEKHSHQTWKVDMNVSLVKLGMSMHFICTTCAQRVYFVGLSFLSSYILLFFSSSLFTISPSDPFTRQVMVHSRRSEQDTCSSRAREGCNSSWMCQLMLPLKRQDALRPFTDGVERQSVFARAWLNEEHREREREREIAEHRIFQWVNHTNEDVQFVYTCVLITQVKRRRMKWNVTTEQLEKLWEDRNDHTDSGRSGRQKCSHLTSLTCRMVVWTIVITIESWVMSLVACNGDEDAE